MGPASKLNGVLGRIVGVLVVAVLLAILGLSFTNQVALAGHNSADGPHGKINTALAEIKTDVEWIRKQLEDQP